jgi:hypothetical protein
MNYELKNYIALSTTAVCLLCFNFLYSQPFPLLPSSREGHGTVPMLPPEPGTVSFYDSTVGHTFVCAPSQIDSLELSQLALGIQKAEDQVSRTGLLYRLIPEVHISSSYGIGDLLFIDPSSTSTYILPKDSYRLSFSLSLSELFFSSKHSEALLQLTMQQMEYHHKIILQQKNRSMLLQEASLLEEKIRSLETQVSMIQDLLHFNQLRFDQGKIEYDILIKTKLELLSLITNMNALKHQHAELILKLQ